MQAAAQPPDGAATKSPRPPAGGGGALVAGSGCGSGDSTAAAAAVAAATTMAAPAAAAGSNGGGTRGPPRAREGRGRWRVGKGRPRPQPPRLAAAAAAGARGGRGWEATSVWQMGEGGAVVVLAARPGWARPGRGGGRGRGIPREGGEGGRRCRAGRAGVLWPWLLLAEGSRSTRLPRSRPGKLTPPPRSIVFFFLHRRYSTYRLNVQYTPVCCLLYSTSIDMYIHVISNYCFDP